MRSYRKAIAWAGKVAAATAILAAIGALARQAEANAADFHLAQGLQSAVAADPSVYGLFAFAAICLLTGLPVRAVLRRRRIRVATAMRRASPRGIGIVKQGDAR
jgi:hypothetical protein